MDLPELVEKISLNSFDSGSSYWVDITHINNPHSFYVRPTAYRRFMAEVETQEGPVESTELQLRTMVIFKSKTLNKHVRGMILFVENYEDRSAKFDLFASDYGFFEKSVDISDISKLKVRHIPPLAFHCQLANCKPIEDTWTDRVIDAFKFFVGDERAKMNIREKSPEGLTVELINTCPNDIATMLALTGYTTLGYSENMISRFTAPKCEKHYFTYKNLKPNDVVHVRMQTRKDLNEFYIAELSDYEQYFNARNNFTFFVKKLKELNIEDLKVNETVSVYLEFDKRYERGLVREILSGQRAKVLLVDWGKVEEIHISCLKPMSEKFFYYPAIAIYCKLDENQSLDHKLNKRLYPGLKFYVEIKETGDSFDKPYVVTVCGV